MKIDFKLKKTNKKISGNLTQSNLKQSKVLSKISNKKNLKETNFESKSNPRKVLKMLSDYNNKSKRSLKPNRFRINKSSKKSLTLYQKTNLIGRPYKQYNFVLSKNYLYFTLVVRPNNVFGTLKSVSFEQNPILKKELRKEQIIKQKKSSDYNIKFTKRGVKSKVLAFLNKFISSLRYLKVKKYGFIVLNITTPKSIRKKVINLLSKSFLSRRFKNKKIVFNIQHQKVFNGCSPRKQIRKKRRKFRLFK